MRAVLPAIVFLSLIPALVPVAAGADRSGRSGAGAEAPVHRITCDSERTADEFEAGLERVYTGRWDEALRILDRSVRREPECAMAHWARSRALHEAGRTAEALAAAARAEELAPAADDRERKLIAAWAKQLRALGKAEAEQKKEQAAVRRDLDLAIACYPDDPELYLLRGRAAESPLRAAPFYLAALRLQPSHPFARTWKPEVPSAPKLTPAPTQPVAALPQPPKLFDGLGNLTHPITTSSPEARAYYEQGLRCWHSYVTPSRCANGAAQCFQHAATLDPECAMAYWGLSLCNADSMKPLEAANRALELALKNGTDREVRFAAARVLELSGKEKREAFLDALDGAIAAYPEDVELWVWRGKVHNHSVSAIPYHHAAHRLQPEHPSPNHELVHSYESIDRPALGWPYTIGYRRSAPNMPHANHMQAHLAMRLGRWQEAIDCTRASRQKSLEGYPELDPSHHIDTMIRALAHEGRFREAEAEPKAYRDGLPWARLLQLKGENEALEAWAARRREKNAPDGFYVGAIAALNRNDLPAVRPFLDRVEQEWKKQPKNIYRHHEIKGRYLVQSGQVDEGLKLLREAAAKAVTDAGLHAWGGGSYVLEVWGEAALRARRWDEAVEAFHEALAHEHGSIVGALGMQVVAEQRKQPELAAHYAARAALIWKDADPGALDRQLARLRAVAAAPAPNSGESP